MWKPLPVLSRLGLSVAARWVLYMSGGLALLREVIGMYMAATNQTLSPNRALELFSGTARLAFLVSLGVVWYAEHSRLVELQARPVTTGVSLPASVPSPLVVVAPPRTYVRETSGSEILERMRSARWNERDAIVNTSYIGRWLKGEAEIQAIAPEGGSSILVFIRDVGDRDFWGQIKIPTIDRGRIEHLAPDDRVAYEGKIKSVGPLTVNMTDCSIELVSRPKPS